jgi:hypothetical protein
MKNTVMLSSVIFFCLTCFVFGTEIGDELRKNGLHVACLSEEEKINLQINRLEQALRQQDVGNILRIVSPDYFEDRSELSKHQLGKSLERSFWNFSKSTGLSPHVNEETGWGVTATRDFYILNPRIQINQSKAEVECAVGFFLASNHVTLETLAFCKAGSNWLLSGSKRFFNFIENTSANISDGGRFASAVGQCPGLFFTKEDFATVDMLSATLLYSHESVSVPRMNRGMSEQLWEFPHAFLRPFGVIADVEICQGGPDFNHKYLFVTDPSANRIVASYADNWVATYGEWGSGVGQFAGPHGMCTVEGYYYFVADMFNNRVTAYIYHNQLDEPQWHTEFDLPGEDIFNRPVDVEAKDRNPYDQQDVTYIAVADEGNHRIVLFHWYPWTLGWDRNYGEYGSGQGQFMWPTSVCFGRDPETGYPTNDLYITDHGNRRLVRIYINRPEGVNWKATYQFPEGTELTSVDVDNKGLVYVVDRHYGKVYKFAPSQTYPYYFQLLGVWGETGTADGELDHPNSIQIAHGRYVPYPNPWEPLTGLGDVFITEAWSDETGVRRFVIATDVLNLTADWVPYNEDTGQGNLICWEYHLTDFGNVTEQVSRGAEVCTTYNRGSLNYGPQGGAWPVDGHPQGTNYTVKVTAGSIYDPTIVVEKTMDVYVDTLTTHHPIITQGIRCNWKDSVGALCNECWHCIREWNGYTLDVQAYHPDGYPLTYEWSCNRGYFYVDDWVSCNPCVTDTNEICYVAPQAPSKRDEDYEFIEVIVSDPYGGSTGASISTNSILDSGTSCLCGDANGMNGVEAGDIVYLNSYLYSGGPPPVDPIERGDANDDRQIGAGDVVRLIDYLFRGGGRPECCWLHE